MQRRRGNIRFVLALASSFILPGAASAQSGITGLVTDNTGGVLPGVYTVTFSLTGFSSVKVERLELPLTFTATVNAELRRGHELQHVRSRRHEAARRTC